MKNLAQKFDMKITEVDGVTVPDKDARSRTEGLSRFAELCAQEISDPVERRDRFTRSKKEICFEVVFSCNGYDYLGP